MHNSTEIFFRKCFCKQNIFYDTSLCYSYFINFGLSFRHKMCRLFLNSNKNWKMGGGRLVRVEGGRMMGPHAVVYTRYVVEWIVVAMPFTSAGNLNYWFSGSLCPLQSIISLHRDPRLRVSTSSVFLLLNGLLRRERIADLHIKLRV